MADTERNAKTNTMLFGHETAEARLLADKKANRLPHGLIISGPQGIGKATFAYRFARALLAGTDTLDMSKDHPVFHRVAAGSHSDMLVLEPAYNEKKAETANDITVTQAREVGAFLSLTSGESDWRVVIIDTIDALNVNAANAILKVLEEPPPQAMLILISHNPGQLLPTIRSRCRTLRLAPLSETDFAKAMQHILPDADEEQLATLRIFADGAPGLAAQLAGQGAIEMYEEILTLLEDLPALNTARLYDFAEQIASGERHANWQLLTRLLLILFSRASKYASGAKFASVSEREAATLAALAHLHPPGIWAARWQQCADQFSLAQRLHLDYKQVMIAFFHSIASKEGFLLGNAAA